MIFPRIFVSYSHKDGDFVRNLGLDLERSGVKIWMDTLQMRGGSRMQTAIFDDAIPQCDVFFAYVTGNYLASTDWCMQELTFALGTPNLVVTPYVDSEETLNQLSPEVRRDVLCRVINEENKSALLMELAGTAWAALQTTQRVVSGRDHILTGSRVYDGDEHSRPALIERTREHLVLAAPNLRSWLSDPVTRDGLVNLVKRGPVVTLILATYETLRPVSAEGAQHLRQSAEDITGMLDRLTAEDRVRMRAFFHVGASTLSAVFVDPHLPSAIMFFNPRWAIQFLPQVRLTCVIDKSINDAALYDAVYDSVLLMTQRDAMSVEQMLEAPEDPAPPPTA